MLNVKKPLATDAQVCQFCKLKPRYYNRKIRKLSPFCGKTCAMRSAGFSKAVYDHSRLSTESASHQHPVSGTRDAREETPGTCSLTGCVQRPTVYPTGSYWNYCSVDHEELALRGCINCRAVPYIGDFFPLCEPCNEHLVARGPSILPVPQDHATYWAVVDQFNTAWAHPIKGEKPEVQMVYRIVPAHSVWCNYWDHQAKLEAKGGFHARGKCLGNEKLMWHGTLRACRLGEVGHNLFCVNPKCSLCSIARGSFNMESARTGGFQRFGPGIYTSSNSSKSNDYVRNGDPSSPWKALLLNNVLAGSEYTTMRNDSSLTGPPPGHDSVYGKPGVNLNYDELVVYTDHAIRPAYLVMYKLVPS